MVSSPTAVRSMNSCATGIIDGAPEAPLPLEKVHTPGCRTIDEVAGFLGVATRKTAKAVFYDHDSEGKLVFVVVRGDREVNEAKLARIIQAAPVPADEARIRSVGAEPGFASPLGIDREKVRLVIDHTVKSSNNLVTGANELDYHYTNFNLDRDLPGVETVDVVDIEEGDLAPDGKSRIVLQRGIEVGNIFQLGRKYTQSMGMTYDDEQGKAQVPIMGCYGIGVGRLMSSVMEVRRDEYGPKWPITIAPWHVQLNALKLDQPPVREAAEKLYLDLCAAGIEVLYDDRNARPGVQFADADLLGIPFRIIVGERNLKDGNLEWKRRDTGESGTIPLENAVETIAQWLREAMAQVERAAPDSL